MRALESKRVFLVGFMGCGKTSLGRRVAKRLEVPFFDLDELVERDAGIGVSEIFSREGEEGFRLRESNALRRLVAEQPAGIIAAGGGAFTSEANRNLMRAEGVTVWLDVPVEAILARVSGSGRPLWTDADGARSLYERRRAFYRLAHHRVELGDASSEQSADRLYDAIASYCESHEISPSQ